MLTGMGSELASWAEVHLLLPGPSELGRVLGIPRQNAHRMAKKGWPVPPAYWVRLIEWAAANGHADKINAESLARLAANGRGHG